MDVRTEIEYKLRTILQQHEISFSTPDIEDTIINQVKMVLQEYIYQGVLPMQRIPEISVSMDESNQGQLNVNFDLALDSSQKPKKVPKSVRYLKGLKNGKRGQNKKKAN